MFDVPDTWEITAATKAKPKPKPTRKPEEVWYDVHKHPEGTPGGMGLSPEHHLRNRGWKGHEINGSTSKTIQYRNHEHPDFVISYGGAASTKPDHNFRVLYMGGNANIPKVTRSYSVAEAMNKVDELHQLHNGLVVLPMTHGAAWQPKAELDEQQRPEVPWSPELPEERKDMTVDQSHPIGPPKIKLPTTVDREVDYYKKKPKPQLVEIPESQEVKPPGPAGPKPGSTKYASIMALADREDWEDSPVSHLAVYDYGAGENFGLHGFERPYSISPEDHEFVSSMVNGLGPFMTSKHYHGYRHLPSGATLSKSIFGSGGKDPAGVDQWLVHYGGPRGREEQSEAMPLKEALPEWIGRFSREPNIPKKHLREWKSWKAEN